MGTKGEAVFHTKRAAKVTDDMLAMDAFDQFLDKVGVAPTLSELAERMGYTRPAVEGSLERLERVGYLDKEPRQHRGYGITHKGDTALKEWRNQRESTQQGA